jgi:hypothetical protein
MKQPARLLPLLCLAATADAAQLRDAVSGLVVTAPPGYVAALAPPSDQGGGQARPVFDIRRPGETDTGCRVSTVEAPGNAFLSQAELNERAASVEYQRQLARHLSAVYDLVALDVVGSAKVVGLGAIGDLRSQPGAPPPDVRTLLVFLDTPLERVVLTCVADRREFDQRLAEFEAIFGGLELP